jgi:excisionase family DNA binding protein
MNEVSLTGTPAHSAGQQSNNLLSSREAAEILQVSHKTVERHARAGTVPGHFRFGKWFFFRAELDEWLRGALPSTNNQPCRVN